MNLALYTLSRYLQPRSQNRLKFLHYPDDWDVLKALKKKIEESTIPTEIMKQAIGLEWDEAAYEKTNEVNWVETTVDGEGKPLRYAYAKDLKAAFASLQKFEFSQNRAICAYIEHSDDEEIFLLYWF